MSVVDYHHSKFNTDTQTFLNNRTDNTIELKTEQRLFQKFNLFCHKSANLVHGLHNIYPVFILLESPLALPNSTGHPEKGTFEVFEQHGKTSAVHKYGIS